MINGDVFDDLNFKRLTKRHFACLKVIRRNSDRDDFRLIWIRGNHDGPADIISHIVGVDILDEFVLRQRPGPALMILHGDQFDTIITEHKLLTNVACRDRSTGSRSGPRTTRLAGSGESPSGSRRNSQLVQGPCHRVCSGVQGLSVRDVRPYSPSPDRRSRRESDTSIQGTWIEHPPCPFLAVIRRRGPARDLSLRRLSIPARSLADEAEENPVPSLRHGA